MTRQRSINDSLAPPSLGDKPPMTMKTLDPTTLEALHDDFDAREAILRRVVADRLGANPTPKIADHVVATYYFSFRTTTLQRAVAEISYHATSGIKDPPKGSLLEQCSARQAGVDPFDSGGQVGLLHVAFPLKMMRQPDGHLTSCDLLHTVAGAVIFDFYEHRDARLIHLEIPDEVLQTFPGPAYGPFGLRSRTGFAPDQPAFGTILKPTAGITPDDVERLVAEVAGHPLLMFIKEDEDLYPNLDYSPVAERTRRAVACDRARQGPARGPRAVYSPHVTGATERDRRHGSRSARRRGLGGHVQRDLRGGYGSLGSRGHEGPAEPPGDLRPQRRDRGQDPIDLAGGDRLPRPARRHRLPPDRPAPSRPTPDPPLRRRVGGVGSRPDPTRSRHRPPP